MKKKATVFPVEKPIMQQVRLKSQFPKENDSLAIHTTCCQYTQHCPSSQKRLFLQNPIHRRQFSLAEIQPAENSAKEAKYSDRCSLKRFPSFGLEEVFETDKKGISKNKPKMVIPSISTPGDDLDICPEEEEKEQFFAFKASENRFDNEAHFQYWVKIERSPSRNLTFNEEDFGFETKNNECLTKKCTKQTTKGSQTTQKEEEPRGKEENIGFTYERGEVTFRGGTMDYFPKGNFNRKSQPNNQMSSSSLLDRISKMERALSIEKFLKNREETKSSQNTHKRIQNIGVGFVNRRISHF